MICGTFLARALIEFKINVFYVGATLSTKIKGSQRLSRQEERLPMSLWRMGWRGAWPDQRVDGWMGGRGRGGCCCCGSGNKAPLGRQTHP